MSSGEHLIAKVRARFDYDVARNILICKTCKEKQPFNAPELILLHVCSQNPALAAKETCQHDELTVGMDLSLEKGSTECKLTVFISCANPACAKQFRVKGAEQQVSYK